MTPIEAAARAIAAENFRRQFGHAPSPGWHADRQWRQHIPAARAAIAAIREPSESMLEGGWRGAGPEAPGSVWRNMIDRLLAEQPEETV